MLNLRTLASLISTGLVLSSPATAYPYPIPFSANGTANGTATNATSSPNCSAPIAAPKAAAAPSCQTLYPSTYRVLNSRYPTWDESALHAREDFFMLLRQRADTFQVATQIQFTALNASIPPESDATCKLQFQLPKNEMQNTLGAEPIFNVYQVEREAGAAANWDTYEPAKNETWPIFGRVNGTVVAQQLQWNATAGLVDVGETKCNDTLTWQMGMAFNGGAEVNYWDFLNVEPPMNPVQGFKLTTGC